MAEYYFPFDVVAIQVQKAAAIVQDCLKDCR